MTSQVESRSNQITIITIDLIVKEKNNIDIREGKVEFPYNNVSNNVCVCRYFWGCINLWIKRGGRRDLVVGLRYGEMMNQMITWESIGFSFFDMYSNLR